MAGKETLPGILKQISSIRGGLQKLEARVNERLTEGVDGNADTKLDP